MTPEERQLITGLFDRMRGFGAPQKDREAEAVISDAMRNVPDAGYMLVQSVLVQEHALQAAQSRIEDLERQVRDAESGAARPSGGSFLGGLLGGGRPASQPTGTSVPPIAPRAAPAPYEDDNRRPWGQSQPGQQAPPPPPSAGGGFLRSAMATAAGVAGGVLAANALGSLLGGHSTAHAAGNQPSQPATTPPANTDAAVQQARQDWEDDARADAADDGSSDDSGDTGGDI